MKRLASIVLLVWLPAIAAGQKVTLPATLKADPGTLFVVKADTDCIGIGWASLDSGLSIVPPELLKDSKQAVCYASTPGVYRLLCVGAKGDAISPFAVCVVTVGSPAPPGPPPPKPPDPPPVPADPLISALSVALKSDDSGLKRQDATMLGALYGQAATDVKTNSAAKLKDYLAGLHKARMALIAERLPAVRAVLDAELNKALPQNPDAALDAGVKMTCSDVFSRFARALNGLQ